MYIFIDVFSHHFLPHVFVVFLFHQVFWLYQRHYLERSAYRCNVLWIGEGLVDVFFQNTNCFGELLFIRVLPMTLKNDIFMPSVSPSKDVPVSLLLAPLLLFHLFLPLPPRARPLPPRPIPAVLPADDACSVLPPWAAGLLGVLLALIARRRGSLLRG